MYNNFHCHGLLSNIFIVRIKMCEEQNYDSDKLAIGERVKTWTDFHIRGKVGTVWHEWSYWCDRERDSRK